MSDIFHVDFYAKDWLLDTQRLTLEERGAFIQIVAAIYHRGEAVEFDTQWLSSLLNCSKRKADSVVTALHEKGFIYITEEGKITQKRAAEELQKAQKRRENAVKNARKSHENSSKNERKSDEKEGELKENKDLDSASHQTPDTRHQYKPPIVPHDETEKPPDKFIEFWKVYPKQRAGSAKKARMAWNSALIEERATEEEIIDGARRYANSHEVARGFAKGAAAWLNDDRWTSDYSRRPVDAQAARGNTGYMAELEETAHRLMAEDAHPPDQH